MVTLSFPPVCLVGCLLQAFCFVKCKEMLGSRNSVERIVTDWNVINSPNGVPLDYKYNQSNHNINDQIASAPGCPKSIDGYPWLQSLRPSKSRRSTKRCYLVSFQGPCPSGRVLFISSADSKLGVCGCECLLYNSPLDGPDFFPNERLKTCTEGSLQQILDKNDKTVCYNVREQGPCPDGKVVSSVPTASSQNVTSATGFVVPCLPPCGENVITRKTEDCVPKYLPPAHAPVTLLHGHKCPPNQQYSDTIKYCFKRDKAKLIV